MEDARRGEELRFMSFQTCDVPPLYLCVIPLVGPRHSLVASVHQACPGSR